MRVSDVSYFVVAAESRSLLAAAQSLGISQPTLSKSVARLERALGARLLERLPRGVVPTEAGRAFLSHARVAALGLSDGAAAVRDLRAGRTGTVRIGLGVGVPQTLLARALAPLLDAAPELRIEVSGGMSDTLCRAVAAGHCDVAVTNAPPPTALPVRWESLFPDPMIVVAAPGHPLASRRRTDWPTLARQRWIVPGPGTASGAWFERQFADRGLPVPAHVISMRDSMVTAELAAGLAALGLIPDSWQRSRPGAPPVVALRLPSDWSSDRQVGLVLRPSGHLGAAARRLVDRLRAVARRRTD